MLVQSFVQRQFMYEQRPSYLRLWAVVTGVQPLRVYLFRGGVLVFGDPVGASRGPGGAGSGAGGGRRWGWGSAGRRALLDQQVEDQGEDEDAGYGGVSAEDGMPVVRRSGGEQRQRRGLLQQAGGGGGAGAGGRYEMHQVNYWTIAGRKMAPWTLSQLREHMARALPGDPRVFDRMWGQARASVGMVLAAGSGAMRGAARRLAALEGSGGSPAGGNHAACVTACVICGVWGCGGWPSGLRRWRAALSEPELCRRRGAACVLPGGCVLSLCRCTQCRPHRLRGAVCACHIGTIFEASKCYPCRAGFEVLCAHT